MEKEKKTLKFSAHLVPLILSGEKRSTWRLFDDKDLTEGDVADFLNAENKERFATARLTRVVEKTMGEVNDDDFTDHKKFETKEAMYQSYMDYYQTEVTGNTLLKIVNFELL